MIEVKTSNMWKNKTKIVTDKIWIENYKYLPL